MWLSDVYIAPLGLTEVPWRDRHGIRSASWPQIRRGHAFSVHDLYTIRVTRRYTTSRQVSVIEHGPCCSPSRDGGGLSEAVTATPSA